MSDIDGNELEINGVPVGNTIHRRQYKVEEYVEGLGLSVTKHRPETGAKNCWFCGLPDLFYKDYCKTCYHDFVQVPAHGLI